MSLEPFELKQIDDAMTAANVTRDAKRRASIQAEIIRAVENRMPLDEVADFITARPHYIEGYTERAPKADADAELEQLAFEGKGNVSARGKLFQKLGAARLDERARAWGLKNGGDFKTRGVAPEDQEGDGRSHKKKPGADNPWTAAGWNITRQGALVKANPESAAAIAKAAKSFIGATRPTM